jgi:segregation and condensation protein A
MMASIINPDLNGYKVNTNVYEGPLDLLLELIEKAELDITRLALAQVTDQFLNYLKQIQDREPEELSAFLVVATKLLQIKSTALLPHPIADDFQSPDEEDPGDALARQLIIYRKFKELATWLDMRQGAGLRSYLRVATVPYKYESKIDLSNITLEDLQEVARSMFLNNCDLQSLDTVVSLPKITIRERIQTILFLLHETQQILFKNIPRNKTRTEIVISFLATLELIKQNILLAKQDTLFGDIRLEPLEQWDENQEIEIEFQD